MYKTFQNRHVNTLHRIQSLGQRISYDIRSRMKCCFTVGWTTRPEEDWRKTLFLMSYPFILLTRMKVIWFKTWIRCCLSLTKSEGDNILFWYLHILCKDWILKKQYFICAFITFTIFNFGFQNSYKDISFYYRPFS